MAPPPPAAHVQHVAREKLRYAAEQKEQTRREFLRAAGAIDDEEEAERAEADREQKALAWHPVQRLPQATPLELPLVSLGAAVNGMMQHAPGKVSSAFRLVKMSHVAVCPLDVLAETHLAEHRTRPKYAIAITRLHGAEAEEDLLFLSRLCQSVSARLVSFGHQMEGSAKCAASAAGVAAVAAKAVVVVVRAAEAAFEEAASEYIVVVRVRVRYGYVWQE
jgi:hypothetical protein